MRLGFAIVAHLDPEVLLVDEVLAVGDALFQNKCLRFLRDFVHKGGTVVFVQSNSVQSQPETSSMFKGALPVFLNAKT